MPSLGVSSDSLAETLREESRIVPEPSSSSLGIYLYSSQILHTSELRGSLKGCTSYHDTLMIA